MVILGANYKYNLTYLQKLGLIYNGNSSFAGKHLSKNIYVHFTGSLVKKQKMSAGVFFCFLAKRPVIYKKVCLFVIK